jgi:uncharacterized membrane protein YfcA
LCYEPSAFFIDQTYTALTTISTLIATITLFSYQFTILDLVIIYLVALCIGMAKTGVHGAGMIAVPLLAAVFGGKTSSGVLLPMLVFADIMGVRYYHQHASWKHLKILFPWTAAGVIIGTITGNYINDEIFKMVMAMIIVVSVVIMLWLERGDEKKIPHSVVFSAVTGGASGFTSMVGNLAGAVMAVYLLAMRLPKNAYIGTTAWFFMVTNWFKVPFHVFVWHTLSPDIILIDLTTIPFIGLGAYLGIIIVRKIPERYYRGFIIVTTLLAAVFILI